MHPFRLFLLWFLVFFLPFLVNAQNVSVYIEPVSDSDFDFYSFEVMRYQLVVSNNGKALVENFNAVINAGSDLTLVVDGQEVRSQKISFLSIAPAETLFKEFQVKGLFSIGRTTSIKVDYGVGENLSQSYSVQVSVKRNPVEFNARLLKGALEPFEENSVVFDLKNTSEKELSDVYVEVFLPEGFSSTERGFSTEFLSPHQSITNARLDFTAGPEPIGEQTITIKSFFSDDLGEHELRKDLLVDVRKRENTLLILALVALIVAALVIFFGRKKTTEVVSTTTTHTQTHSDTHH